MSRFTTFRGLAGALVKGVFTGESYGGQKVYAEQLATFAAPINTVNEYDAQGNLIYSGHAAPGTLPTDAGWRIKRNTYNANGDLLTGSWALDASNHLTSTAVWADREDAKYEPEAEA